MPEGLRIDLETRSFDATPGEPFSFVLTVFNARDVIDGFVVSVVGLDQEWVVTDPPVLSLFPDAEGDINVTVTLPPGFSAGEHTLAVSVSSATTSEATMIEEILVSVASIEDSTLTIDPESQTGGSKAKFGVGVVNRGNSVLDVTLSGEDPERELKFRFHPDHLSVPPGEQLWSQVVASGKRPFFGAPAPRVMTIEADAGAAQPLQAVGTFIQKPLIPRWALTLLAMLLALSLWAFVLLFGINRIVGSDEPAVGDGTELTTPDGSVIPGAGDGEAAVPIIGSISGKVLTSGQDPPVVAGVTVQAFSLSDQNEVVASVETGDDGTYLLEALEGGSYRLFFSAPGFQPQWFNGAASFGTATSIEVDGPTKAGFNVTLVGEPGSIKGDVTVSDNGPVNVELRGVEDTSFIRTTVASSPYSFIDLPTPANYELTFRRTGYLETTVVVFVGAGQNVRAAELSMLGEDGIVSGVVLDGEEPLGGVTVTLVGPSEKTTTTLTTGSADGAVGSYRFEEVATPGSYTVTFTKEGYVPATLAVLLDAGEVVVVDPIVLSRSTNSISGLITSSTGSPLGAVAVGASDGSVEIRTTSVTTGDDTGRYTLANLGPNTWTLTFTLAGYVTETRSLTLVEGEQVADFNVVLTVDPGPASVSGTTRDAEGSSPLGGVTVTISNGTFEASTTSATTGTVGKFTFPEVPAGTYTITYVKAGFRTETASIVVAPGQKITDADAGMAGIGSRPIFGLVTDRNGPLGGVSVAISGELFGTAQPPAPKITATSGSSKGTYEFSLLPGPGSYQLTFTKSGYLSESLLINVPAEGSREVNVTLEGADGSVFGVVRGPLPEFPQETVPLGGILVTLTGPPNEQGVAFTATTTTDDGENAGFFSFSGLPTPATFTLAFGSKYHSSEGVGFTLTPSEGSVTSKDLATINISVHPPGSIRGAVTGTDPFGMPGVNPVPGIEVTATVNDYPNGSFSVTATTDLQGFYTLTDLMTPGNYTVTFQDPRGRWVPDALAPIDLAIGQELVLSTKKVLKIGVGRVTGTITCEGPTVGAQVTIAGTSLVTVTDGSGVYTINDVPATAIGSNYQVQFTAPGGAPSGSKSVFVQRGVTSTVNFPPADCGS